MNNLIIVNLIMAAAVLTAYLAAKKIRGHREGRFILKVGFVAACGIFVVADLSYFVPSFPWASLLGLSLVFGFALTRHRQRQIQREDAPIA